MYFDEMKVKVQALQQQPSVRIMAVETSCDETACSIVENGRNVLSNCVYSQIDVHKVYGGVVPEIASRAHIEKIDVLVDEALAQANMTLEDVDAFAVTYGPGLVGSLLTGVSSMKGFAYATNKPLIPVHHIAGHICANYIDHQDLEPPFLSLVVSGGHSHLFYVRDYGEYELLGSTQDDAAGEVFDKAARILDLPYPGGPKLDQLAELGNPYALKLPHPHTQGKYDFSFSGLKTAFINAVHKMKQKNEMLKKEDLAASFRHTLVELLAEKTMMLMQDKALDTLVLAGGVSANSLLRSRMQALCNQKGMRLFMPSLSLCGDNAAMIGSAAYYLLKKGEIASLSLNAVPSLSLTKK